jgi:hypothetical protein
MAAYPKIIFLEKNRMNQKIIFKNHSFCFTGKLVDLKRTQAERETRSRGGLTTKEINSKLDFLVVGSIPSTGWKHGDYGRKIEKAREIQKENNGKPFLIPEKAFMEALVHSNIINSGDIDAKAIVCKYYFITKPDSFDNVAFEDWIELLQQTKGCHVSIMVEDPYYLKIFSNEEHSVADEIVINCRIVKQLDLNESSQAFVDDIAKGFESIDGIDGSLEWFEKTEGTAGYMRLLKEIPQFKRRLDI